MDLDDFRAVEEELLTPAARRDPDRARELLHPDRAASSAATQPTLDGRRFAATARVEGGEVGPETVFDYHEADGEIWASYAGGTVRRGFLVGTRDGDTLTFRYSQLNVDGETSSGCCVSLITRRDDGRVRLEETWRWESRPGAGTSCVDEIDPVASD